MVEIMVIEYSLQSLRRQTLHIGFDLRAGLPVDRVLPRGFFRVCQELEAFCIERTTGPELETDHCV